MVFELPVRVGPRPASTHADDDALGLWLVDALRGALAQGQAPPAAVIARSDRVEFLLVEPAAQVGLELPDLLAGMSRSRAPDVDYPEAVGLIGVFRKGEARDALPAALVFLEWPDCRWWSWSALLGVDGRLIPHSDERLRAVDGAALPGGLGGWWSLGRRARLDVRLGPAAHPALDRHIAPGES